MSLRSRLFIGFVVGGGLFVLLRAVVSWHSDDLMRFLSYLTVAILLSGLKVNLPGIKGTMSVNFLFILIGVSQMSLSENYGARLRRHAGAVYLEGQEPGKTDPPALQRLQYGHCGYRLLRILRVPSDEEHAEHPPGGVAGVFLYEHGARRRGGCLDGEPAAGADVARLLFLVFSFLRGRSFHRLAAVPRKPKLQLAGLSSAHAGPVLRLSFLSRVPGQAGRREKARGRKWRACISAPSKRWRSPSRPRTMPPTSTCGASARMSKRSEKTCAFPTWSSMR